MQMKRIDQRVRRKKNNENQKLIRLFDLDIREIIQKLDEMFEKEDFQKAFEFIETNKTNPLFQSHYIQWRVGR